MKPFVKFQKIKSFVTPALFVIPAPLVIPAKSGIQTGSPIKSGMTTTDKTPTIFGKITDPLSGGDLSETQSDSGPRVASGPKQIDVKLEKKVGLDYRLHTLYTINLDKPWYTCEEKAVTDNSKQNCSKYLPFAYTPKENLGLGTYAVTISGTDQADNVSLETSFTLKITTLTRIITPEQKQVIQEEIHQLPKQESQTAKEELVITKPEEIPKPTALAKEEPGNLMTTVFTGIGQGVKFVFSGIGSGLALTGEKIGAGLALVGNRLANMAFALGEKTQGISDKLGFAIIKIGYLLVNEPTRISDVNVLILSPTSVKVSWVTNHPANGKVNYGFGDGDYDFEQQTDKRTTYHEFAITNLNPDTQYYYEVMSQNKNYVYDANRKFITPAK